MPSQICVIISQLINTDEALDFILASSNVIDPENITVIFMKESLKDIFKYFALTGFGIDKIFAENIRIKKKYIIMPDKSKFKLNFISRKDIAEYAAHSQYTFCF